MKKFICLFLALVMMLCVPTGAYAKAPTTITPADSPWHYSTSSYVYVYDTTNGVWNRYLQTADGDTVPDMLFTRTKISKYGNMQCVDYLPASMDRPMFYDCMDSNGVTTRAADGSLVVARYLTGNDVFTSGSLGTPESTGVVDLSTKRSPNFQKFTWTLKDGVLRIDGDTGMLYTWSCAGNSPWCDNPYIRTVVVTSSKGNFPAYDMFHNCPNLKTVIFVDGGGCISSHEFLDSFGSLRNSDGRLQILDSDICAKGGCAIEMYKKGNRVTTRPFGDDLDTPYTVYVKDVNSVDYFQPNDTYLEWSDAAVSKLFDGAPLTEETADIINAYFKKTGSNVRVEAAGGNIVPVQQPETNPVTVPETKPVASGYDPKKTDGGTAANPIASDWAKADVIAAWKLFESRLPRYTNYETPGPLLGQNIIEKDLRQPITRAEFATLASAAYDYILGDTGKNDGFATTLYIANATGKNFKDFQDAWDNYYVTGIISAVNFGLMNGYSDTKFGPDDHLTREQAATVLMRISERYSDFQYRKNPSQSAAFPAWTGANPYADAISDWALDGVLRCRAASIMIGTSDNTFSAKADFTREQALVTLYRMVEWCKPWYQALSPAQVNYMDVRDAVNP